jgi:DNA-binding beta-propeller fold protein YncE
MQENTPKSHNTQQLKATKIFSSINGNSLYDWNIPNKIFIDKKNRIYVVDFGNDRIMVYDDKMNFITQLGKSGSLDGEFNKPTSMFVDSRDNIYILDTGNERVQIFSKDFNFVKKVKAPRRTLFFTVDEKGCIYFSLPSHEGLIIKMDTSGNAIKYFGNLLNLEKKHIFKNTCRVFFDYKNKCLFVAFNHFPTVQYYTTEGRLIKSIELQNKNLFEINKLVNSNEIPTLAHYYTNISELYAYQDRYYVLIPHATNIPPCIYILSSKGEKIKEYYLMEQEGKPLLKPVTFSINEINELYVATVDNRLVVFNLPKN